MVRTKYLVVAIIACIAVIFLVGILSPSQTTATHDSYIGTHATFTTPKEKYTLAGTSLDARIEERQAFKARVQATLRAEPVVVTEEEIVEEDLDVTTPSGISPIVVIVPPIPVTVSTSTPQIVTDIVATTTVPTTTQTNEDVASTSQPAIEEDFEM